MLVLDIDWTLEEEDERINPFPRSSGISLPRNPQRLYLKPCGHEIVSYTTEIHRGITQIVTAQGATWDG